MSSIVANARQEFTFTITLTEGEARVLWAMFCYGADPIRDACLVMGKHYMQQAGDYVKHFETLHEKI